VKVLSWLPVSLAAAAEALLGLASSLGLDCPALGVRQRIYSLFVSVHLNINLPP